MNISLSVCVLIGLLSFSKNLSAQFNFSIGKSEHPIIVDGISSTDEWITSDSIVSFVQLEPANGSMSTRRTVVKAQQYEDKLYFLFMCHLLPGDQIAAKIQRRDLLDESDDIVSLLLDTYHDQRTSLLFRVNALGTLTDAKVTDDGKNVDLLWDTEWEAKTSITSDYWSVEIEIPLQAIQYNPSSEKWGANFGRVIRANQETTWWAPVTENFRISQGVYYQD